MTADSTRPDAAPDPGSRSVLVVDDDTRVRQMLRWALEDEGFLVETAADAPEALARAARHRPEVVVLDLSLPTGEGTELAGALRASHGEGLPIVVISADGSVAERARAIGAEGYFRKPFRVDRLVAAVQEVIGG